MKSCQKLKQIKQKIVMKNQKRISKGQYSKIIDFSFVLNVHKIRAENMKYTCTKKQIIAIYDNPKKIPEIIFY